MISEKKAKEFKKEIRKLCEKHGISISHEDGQGGFLLTEFDEVYADWFEAADRYDYATMTYASHLKFKKEADKKKEVNAVNFDDMVNKVDKFLKKI